MNTTTVDLTRSRKTIASLVGRTAVVETGEGRMVGTLERHPARARRWPCAWPTAVGPRPARASRSWRTDVPKGTALRNVRIPDEVWEPAKVAAAENGETVSDVVRRALVEYVTPPPPRERQPAR
ncbi:hypothetical protein GCM10025864_39340 [Luteimicrobium album]|uniref:Ribbon-helix-helix protein CopG domain-containing protein n=1 Tax=Luteimicrobium album TaxID=1054550 RepID=A0ABQ6I8W3_9MICO|nr:hypothetical protein GCM10025864_39340 [Luteimicrobium album]